MALLAADQEFAQNLALTARDVAKKRNLSIVFDQSYPPNTVEFSGIIRALKAAKPDIVYVASYPPDSAGILRAVNEIGIGDNVKIFGGGMVGLQFAAVMENMGSLLNGVVNYNSWLPEQSMYFDGTKEFFDNYTKRAIAAKVDPLGYYLAPFGYAIGSTRRAGRQRDEVARPEGHRKISARKRASRPSSARSHFAEDGEWKETETLMAQFRGVVDKNVEQFRQSGQAGDPVPGQPQIGRSDQSLRGRPEVDLACLFRNMVRLTGIGANDPSHGTGLPCAREAGEAA